MKALVDPSECRLSFLHGVVSCSFRKNESKPFEGIGIIEIPQMHSLYLIHISHKYRKMASKIRKRLRGFLNKKVDFF